MRVARLIATPITLLVLLALLAWGAWWGYKNVMTPAPARLPDPCVTTSVGAALKSSQVTVTVNNGGYKQGLAAAVGKTLKSRGFVIKTTGNTDERVKQTVIIGADVNNPEVKLVAAHFKGATVRADQRPDHTVTVLVGTNYGGMNDKAPTTIAVPGGQVCLPASATPSGSAPPGSAPAASSAPATPKR